MIITKFPLKLRGAIVVNWEDILTAKEASLMLGKNEKYVYILFKMNSDMLLKGSVVLKGKTLLISREGFEHLKRIHAATAKKKELVCEERNNVLKEAVI